MSGVNHVGITVPDLDAAVDWYRSVFRLRLLSPVAVCDLTTPGADRRRDVFGSGWGGMRLAHLESDNGAGIELFQFVVPQVEDVDETFPYWVRGPHHVAFSVDDFDETLSRIETLGGRRRTAVHQVHQGARVCYCEDPWGTVVEVVSTTYAGLVDGLA